MARWRYPAELRAEVVALGRAGQPVAELARRFGVPPRTIGYWLAHPDPADPGPPGLAESHPGLVAELHPDRNPGLDPATVSAGSGRLLWWRCPSGHEWQARLSSRGRGAGCPTCAGHYPAGIAITHPDLAAQLDRERSVGVDPVRVTAGSRRKLWWRCPSGHLWQATISGRVGGTGCPTCAAVEATARLRRYADRRPVDHPFTATHPDLAAEVDRLRNAGVDLDRLSAGSTRKLWWRCPDGHRWQASVAGRTRGRGCPVCAGHVAAPLASTHPRLAAELDPDRNPGVSAEHVHAGTHGLLWWRCPQGHRWQDTPSNRAQGAGCPTCHPDSGSRSSRPLCRWIYPTGDPRAGTRCRGAALPGSEYCNAHQVTTGPLCTATTRAGGPCARTARPGETTCPVHDPARMKTAPALTAPEAEGCDAARTSLPDPQHTTCPVCGRDIAIRSITPGPDGRTHLLLAAHDGLGRQRCPGRVVTLPAR